MMKTFNPYLYEPDKDVSTCSYESNVSDFDKNKSKECLEDNVRVGDLDWCKCWNCLVGKGEIDCLCCFEIDVLNSKFDTGNISYIIQSKEFGMLCMSETVLKNVLTGVCETRGDHLENTFSNRLLRYAAYKQFIWWVFKQLGKGNRRIIPRVHYGRLGSIF